jgi:hypothetical protein
MSAFDDLRRERLEKEAAERRKQETDFAERESVRLRQAEKVVRITELARPYDTFVRQNLRELAEAVTGDDRYLAIYSSALHQVPDAYVWRASVDARDGRRGSSSNGTLDRELRIVLTFTPPAFTLVETCLQDFYDRDGGREDTRTIELHRAQSGATEKEFGEALRCFVGENFVGFLKYTLRFRWR